MKKYVLFVDIASSTRIMEDLINNGNEEKYSSLIQLICDDIFDYKERCDFEFYKFLGDGFIILLDESIEPDRIFEFCVSLVRECKRIINNFIDENIDTVISKIGITLGLSIGKVTALKSDYFPEVEYYGRPINMAARFQGTNEFVNTLVVQKEIYNNLKKYAYKKSCKETTRVFHNISNDGKMRCYVFYPEALDTIQGDEDVTVFEYMRMKREERKNYNKDVLKPIELYMSNR